MRSKVLWEMTGQQHAAEAFAFGHLPYNLQDGTKF
jgi:hypothetical protein